MNKTSSYIKKRKNSQQKSSLNSRNNKVNRPSLFKRTSMLGFSNPKPIANNLVSVEVQYKNNDVTEN
jgi:hypothetical protein